MNKDESLTKKVLLSIMAAGVMSGFVFQAEAADSLIVDGNSTIVKDNETFTKVGANGGANITLNGGLITGSKETHKDDEEPAIIAADVAAEIDSGSVLTANNVAFTGEITAHDGGKIVLNGGSVNRDLSILHRGGKMDIIPKLVPMIADPQLNSTR